MNRFKVIGAILLTYFIAVVFSRFHTGLEHNLWWVSHAALLMAAIGFLREDNLLLTAALTMVFVPHLLWIIGFALLKLGLPTLGVADYMRYADAWTYWFTMHHIFLIPLLLWALWKQGEAHGKAWLAASVYFAFITLGALMTTNPDYNVNCAFQVCEAQVAQPIYFLNQLPIALYWLAENILAAFLLFLPVNSLLNKWLS